MTLRIISNHVAYYAVLSVISYVYYKRNEEKLLLNATQFVKCIQYYVHINVMRDAK